MRLVSHGGGCCGVNHIRDFGATASEHSKAELDRIIQRVRGTRRVRMLMLEAILTASQVRVWGQELENRGFVPRLSWINPNSGRRLTQFTMTGDTYRAPTTGV